MVEGFKVVMSTNFARLKEEIESFQKSKKSANDEALTAFTSNADFGQPAHHGDKYVEQKRVNLLQD